jgi:hypothetical protein
MRKPGGAPLFAIAQLRAKTHRSPKALAYWIATGVALVVVYNLTDWNAGSE